MKRLVPHPIINYIDSLESFPDGISRDKLIYIIDLPGRIRATNHKYSDFQFIPINHRIGQSRMRDFSKNLQFLLQHHILECGGSYTPGKISQGYHIPDKWGNDYVSVDIKLKTYYKRPSKDKENTILMPPDYLTKWFKGLQIDDEKAIAYGDTHFTDLQKINLYYQVHIIKNKDYRFIRDITGNRFHSVLTNMSSKLRPFLSYNGQKLVSIDIKNSQPYFSIFLSPFSSSPYDTTNFVTDVLSGSYYERFMEVFYEKTGKELTRKEAKETMFTVLFSRNSFQTTGKKIFKEMYPDQYKLFCQIKEKEHNQLAILLQRTESHYVIDVICKNLSKLKKDLPIFTIHDSIITTEGNQRIIIDTIEKELIQAIGHAPKLKVEQWQEEQAPVRSITQRFESYFGTAQTSSISKAERFRKAFGLAQTG